MSRFGFLFSLEAAFSLTLAIIAASYLFAFVPQQEEAGWHLACSDAARALSQVRAFSSQERLQAAVEEAGGLLGACMEAEGAGRRASSCEDGDGCGTPGAAGACASAARAKDVLSFSFPVWSEGGVQEARVACWHAK